MVDTQLHPSVSSDLDPSFATNLTRICGGGGGFCGGGGGVWGGGGGVCGGGGGRFCGGGGGGFCG